MKRTTLAAILAAAAMPVMAENTPEQTVSTYFADVAASNFSAAAKYVHPTELAKFRDMIVPAIVKNVGTNQVPSNIRPFTRDDSMESIAKLTPEEVFVRVMSWAEATQPMWRQMKRSTTTPIGNVNEGDLTHIVCRQVSLGMEIARTNMVVLSAMKDKADWKLTLPPDAQRMGQMLSMQAAMGRSPARPYAAPSKEAPSSFSPMMPPRERPMPPREHGSMNALPVTPPATPIAPAPTTPPAAQGANPPSAK
jgi:hypothetical protein